MPTNRRELVMKAVKGEPTRRLPFSFWYHFRSEPWFPAELRPDYGPASPNVLDTYVTGMAKAELAFWERYQPDILKVMHDVPYEMPAGVNVIQSIEDWKRLSVLPPDKGHFGAQLETLQRIRQGLPKDVPMIETVFNAFYYVNKITQGQWRIHLQQDPAGVTSGIQAIQETLIQYAKASLKICDGIYYAVNGASEDTAPREVYEEHFQSLDQALLEAVSDAPLNVLHLHGYGELYGDLIAEMPAAVICWSDRRSSISLDQGHELFGRCVMGGLDETHLPGYTPEQVEAEARDAVRLAGETGFILAPGCAVATNIRPELLEAIRNFKL